MAATLNRWSLWKFHTRDSAIHQGPVKPYQLLRSKLEIMKKQYLRRKACLLTQDGIWTSFQRFSNVMDVRWTSIQTCVLMTFWCHNPVSRIHIDYRYTVPKTNTKKMLRIKNTKRLSLPGTRNKLLTLGRSILRSIWLSGGGNAHAKVISTNRNNSLIYLHTVYSFFVFLENSSYT